MELVIIQSDHTVTHSHLLLTFMEEVKNIEADRLTLNHFNRITILDFLDWLQTEKQNSNATKNSRLAFPLFAI